MSIKHILARLDGSASDNAVLDYACQVARRFGAYVEAFHCAFDSRDLSALTAGASAVHGLDQMVIESARADGTRARSNFETWLKANKLFEGEAGGQGEVFGWREYTGWEPEVLVHAARLTDLIVIARSRDAGGAGVMALEAALFDTRRPVLLVPRNGRMADLFYRPIVAWNGSAEATLAIASAMPLLQEAQETVEIFCAAEKKHRANPRDLIAHLRCHGVMAALAPPSDMPGTIAEYLLAHARARRSGLLVMGAYTHGHFRQFVFGGVTQHVLAKAELPVLLAH